MLHCFLPLVVRESILSPKTSRPTYTPAALSMSILRYCDISELLASSPQVQANSAYFRQPVHRAHAEIFQPLKADWSLLFV